MFKKNALLIVDLQNDFCRGGSLEVEGSDQIIPLINQLQTYFTHTIATQDWHPADHASFAANHPGHHVGEVIRLGKLPQVLWPTHCVQNTKGAEFHPSFETHRIKKIIHKGVDKQIDSYSAFYDNAHLRSTGLAEHLKQEKIEDLYIVGLATDYCVKYSTLDALRLGFNVFLIVDACKGVELKSGDIDQAFEDMRLAGVELICSKEIFARYNKYKRTG